MLAKRLIDGLADVPHVVQNGDPLARYPGCVNLSFAYVEGESLLMALKVSLPSVRTYLTCRMLLSRLAQLVLLLLLNPRTYYEHLAQTTTWHTHQ